MEHESDVSGAKLRTLVFGKSREVLASQLHRSSGGIIEPREQPQQCRLSASRGSENRHDLLAWNGQVDIFEDRHGTTRSLIRPSQTSRGDHQ